MKFLVDAQLPRRLCDLIVYKGFDSIHTFQLPCQNNTTDEEIIRIANEEQRVVITKDADFLVSKILSNKPQKLVLIKLGNASNNELLRIFSTHFSNIVLSLEKNDIVEIRHNRIFIG